jgi:hypothetical protein
VHEHRVIADVIGVVFVDRGHVRSRALSDFASVEVSRRKHLSSFAGESTRQTYEGDSRLAPTLAYTVLGLGL